MEGAEAGTVLPMQEQYTKSLTLLRQQQDDRHANEMMELARGWNKKWLERERQWLEGEQEREEGRRGREEMVRQDYVKLFEEHTERLEQKLDTRHQNELTSLGDRLEQLISKAADANQGKDEYASHLHSKFDMALKRAEDLHNSHAAEMEREKEQEITALNAALEQERVLHSKGIDDIKHAQGAQLHVLQNAMKEERTEAARVQNIFEDTLRTKYESMVQSLKKKAEAEEQYRVQRALEQLEKIALSPEFMQPKADAQSKRAAELAASEKFQSLVGELRASWQQAEEERVQQMERRLRAHYDTVLQHAQQQVQMALRLNDEADERWMAGMQTRNQQQVEAMHEFEKKCQRLYQGRLQVRVVSLFCNPILQHPSEYISHTTFAGARRA
jgi:hypothetical protein